MPGEHLVKGSNGLSFDASVFVPGASSHSINTLSHYTCKKSSVTFVDEQAGVYSNPPVDSNDLVARLSSFLRGAASYSNILESILPALLGDFLRPVWSSVCLQKKSCLNVLPEVCAFPCIPIPITWVPSDCSSSYFLCKTFSNKWTLVDSSHLHETSMKVRCIPPILQRFMNCINTFPSRGSASIVFDSVSDQAFLVEVDWCNDQVFVYKFAGDSLIPYASICDLSPGAIHIHGISNSEMVLSAGSDIYMVSLTNTTIREFITGGPLYYADTERLPVSTQTVVPKRTKSGRLVYLAGGCLYSSSCDSSGSGNRILHLSNQNIKYVSLSYDSEKEVVVLVGFDYRAQTSRQYITLFDLNGLFVLSTKEVPDCPLLSIVSCGIDPVSKCTIIVGRCNGRSRQGAVCQAFPPIYN